MHIKKNIKQKRYIMLMTIILTLCGCAASPIKEVDHTLMTPVQPIDGPKRVIAVAKFSGLGSMEAKYGQWDIGGGLSAMLTTSLINSEQFIVVERAGISQVLQELQLSGEGVVSKGSGPDLGQLYGAQLLIFGSVTEFGTAFSGGGTSIGGSVTNSSKTKLKGSGSAAKEFSKGYIAMDIRIVDTTTGSILDSYRVEEKIVSKGYDISVDVTGISFGSTRFKKTPIGAAARRAINTAVTNISEAAKKSSWTGYVVDVDGFDIYLNAGARSGVKIGDRFEVQRLKKEFKDPNSGRILSRRLKTLGTFVISDVEEELSYGLYKPISMEKPEKSDYVFVSK